MVVLTGEFSAEFPCQTSYPQMMTDIVHLFKFETNHDFDDPLVVIQTLRDIVVVQ
jgi:hypothetical protein